MGGHEGVVLRLQKQRGTADMRQEGQTTAAFPIFAGIAKAMQGGHAMVVELTQGTRGQGRFEIEQPGELRMFGPGLGLQGGQEMTAVEPVQALGQMVSHGGQIEGGSHGRAAVDPLEGLVALFPQPFEEHVAPQGKSCRITQRLRVFGANALEDPVDFRAVSGMVEAGAGIEERAAGAEMRRHHAPPEGLCGIGQGADIGRFRTAFQAVKEGQDGLIRRAGQTFDLEEVLIRAGPDFLAPDRAGNRDPTGPADGLDMGIAQPEGRRKRGMGGRGRKP